MFNFVILVAYYNNDMRLAYQKYYYKGMVKMLLKHITATVVHNVKNYEFSSSNLVISNQNSIFLSDDEVKDDFINNTYLIKLILKNMAESKIYKTVNNAYTLLRNGTLSAEINIVYMTDISKASGIYNMRLIRSEELHSDKVSAVRCSYTFKDTEICRYMMFGNPSCMNEAKDPNIIDFCINKIREIK